MSVPVDEDSVTDFQLDFSSDKSHHLNLDSISYITRDGNSSTGQSAAQGRSQTPSPAKRTSSNKAIKIEHQYTRDRTDTSSKSCEVSNLLSRRGVNNSGN